MALGWRSGLLWQSKRDEASPGGSAGLTATCGNDDKLATVDGVSTWSGVSTKWEGRIPEDVPISGVEGSNRFVCGRGDEDKPATGDDGASVVFGTCRWQPAGSQGIRTALGPDRARTTAAGGTGIALMLLGMGLAFYLGKPLIQPQAAQIP